MTTPDSSAPLCDVCLNPLPNDEAMRDFGRHPDCDRAVVHRGEAELAASFPPPNDLPTISDEDYLSLITGGDSDVPAALSPEVPEPRDVSDYPAAARSLHLNLKEFCDESEPFPLMIANAGRKAAAALASARAALDAKEKENEGLWASLRSAEERFWASQSALSEATRREDTLQEIAAAARRYVECSQTGRSPYIKENGRHGGSPWAELVDAVRTARSPSPRATTPEADNG